MFKTVIVVLIAMILMAMALPAMGALDQRESKILNDRWNRTTEFFNEVDALQKDVAELKNGSVAAGPSVAQEALQMVKDYFNTTPENGPVVNTTATGGVIDQIIDRVEEARASETPTAVPGVKGETEIKIEGDENTIVTSNGEKNLSVKGNRNKIVQGKSTLDSKGFKADASVSSEGVGIEDPEAQQVVVFPVQWNGEEVAGTGQSFAQEVDSKLSRGQQPVVTGRWNFVNGVRESFTPIYGGSEQAQLRRNPYLGADEARLV